MKLGREVERNCTHRLRLEIKRLDGEDPSLPSNVVVPNWSKTEQCAKMSNESSPVMPKAPMQIAIGTRRNLNG